VKTKPNIYLAHDLHYGKAVVVIKFYYEKVLGREKRSLSNRTAKKITEVSRCS
jgi:hypothetical protein